MIARPKLPATLPAGAPPKLEPGLALEVVELSAPWAGQSARRVTLDTAKLTSSDLTGAKLREGGWSDVLVETGEYGGLDVTSSSWRRVEVRAARMSGLVMAECQVKDVAFAGCKLDLSNFRFTHFYRVTFRDCLLSEADFAGTRLTDVSFDNCELLRANFSGALMSRVDLRTSHLESIGGLGGLSGGTLSLNQLVGLAPELATALGIKIAD
jgi:uncharacterized protein YjbI with pentapeptide repeats